MLCKNDTGYTGKGTIVAIADSGIDYSHPSFIDENGRTRILGIWDQTASWNGMYEEDWIAVTGKIPAPPPSYTYGVFYPKEWIDYALTFPMSKRNSLLPEYDSTGHGTAIAGIAAGNRVNRNVSGVAYGADILVTKISDAATLEAENRFIDALDFMTLYARNLMMPIAINVSYGNSRGPHDGRSLLETNIDRICERENVSVIIATGNEGNKALHYKEVITDNDSNEARFVIAPSQRSLSIYIWKNYFDIMTMSFREESSQDILFYDGLSAENPLITQKISVRNMSVLFSVNEPTPYNGKENIIINFVRGDNERFLNAGNYVITINGVNIKGGRIDMWMPSGGVAEPQTRFLQPDPDTTITAPSTSYGCISVGAYEEKSNTMADFSGRGFLTNGLVKPDLCAPGVDILAPAVFGGYSLVTGTSFAAPYVTGSAAVLMEWGIVNNNDNNMYGEKLKAFLLRQAQVFKGRKVPDEASGYGRLCLRIPFRL